MTNEKRKNETSTKELISASKGPNLLPSRHPTIVFPIYSVLNFMYSVSAKSNFGKNSPRFIKRLYGRVFLLFVYFTLAARFSSCFFCHLSGNWTVTFEGFDAVADKMMGLNRNDSYNFIWKLMEPLKFY